MASERTIAERLTDAGASFTPTGRRVAAALLAKYPAAGLDTVASLAAAAGVSAPSVVRFVTALGFESFRAFQDELRDELGGRDASALSQARAASTRSDDPLDATREALLQGVEETLDAAVRPTFGAAVAVLADTDRRVVAFGGDYSRAVADHFAAQLAPLRPGVRVAPPTSLLSAADVVDIRAGDVWVAFDFRRYSSRTLRLATAARDHGALVVLVTDRWRSPVAECAEIVLSARVEAAGPSDTLVPALALVEAISEAVERRLAKRGVDRLARVDPIRRALDLDPDLA